MLHNKSIIFASFILISISLCSCQTLPSGWNNTSDTTITQVSDLLFETILYDNSEEQKVYKKCIIESGICGAINFLKTKDSDISNRLLMSVKSAEQYAKKRYPELYEKHGNLSKIVIEYIILKNDNRDWVSVSVNESDVLISLLHLFISNNFLLNPENL